MSAGNGEEFSAPESSRREFITRYGTMAFAAPVIASFTLDSFARGKDHHDHHHPKQLCQNQPPKQLCENQTYQEHDYPKQLCENQTHHEYEYPKQMCQNQPGQILANGT